METKINVGDFDTRIRFEKPTVSKGSRGESITTWNDYKSVWAKVSEGVSSEDSGEYQLTGERTINITIHWRTGLTNKMRVVYNGDYYYIGGTGALGRKQFMILTATSKDV